MTARKKLDLVDVSSERGVIGALLLDPSSIDAAVAAGVAASSFNNEFYGLAFDCALTHYRAGRVPDVALLSSDLEAGGASDAVGKLLSVIADRPDSWNAAEYARRVVDLADRRAAVTTLEQAARDVYSRNGDWREHVAGAGVSLAMLDDRGKAENVAASKTVWTLAELLAAEHTRPPFIVDGLLMAGLTMLAGRPKVGKSWLALQLVRAVGSGCEIWGRHVEQGRCLYLALEDPPWRLAERIRLQGWADLDVQADFQTVGSLRAGGGEALAAMIRAQSYRLVVVDTLSRALAGDQKDEQAMNAALQPIHAAAHAAKTAVVIIDHHNKIGSATSGAGDAEGLEPDPIVNLAGSIAKGGVADAVMGLYRNKGKRGATLVVVGRDIAEQSLTLEQDTAHVWQLSEGGTIKQMSTGRAEVLRAIEDLGGEATYPEITKALPGNRGNIYQRLQDMVNLGFLVYTNKKYTISTS